MNLREKVASGTGRASAFTFAREGAKVVAVDVDQRRGEEAVEGIRVEGWTAFFDRTDVSGESS